MSRINFPKIYNPANQSPEELIRNFVVRTKLFRDIFEDIKDSKMKFPEQHYIIQGIRGQGKTTLLLRIAYEIENDAEFRKRIIPVVFNEEQYNISRLDKLWETVAGYLEEANELRGLSDEMLNLEEDEDYERRCFDILENELKKNKKKIILFIDNIDELFEKFSEREHKRLREVFTESAEIRVIGASSVGLEFHYDYGKPFYQFFKVSELKGLNTEETKTLLLKLGEQYGTDRVREIVQNQPGRVEALRRITGGVIRTIVLLFDIFVDDIDGNAFRDLERILDIVTPLYKHRMDKLPAQQQEIVDFIALHWDAVGVKDIAQKTRLESKAVSSQLNQLEKYHIIEKEKTDTKNHLYRISERFFNIWYLMRHGRKWDEKRVRFLVEFLQCWCDEKELEQRAIRHLKAIRGGAVYEKQAFYLTEALARTSIERELQHKLIKETRKYLEKSGSEFIDSISVSDKELQKKAITAYKHGKIEDAVNIIENIKVKTKDDYGMLGFIYKINKNFINAETSLLKALKMGNLDSMNSLALIYTTEFKDFVKAEKYYLMAVDKGDANAMYNLALMYAIEFKDFVKSEKYYLMAVDKGNANAMNNLALMYKDELKDIAKAEKYYLMAVDKGDANAMYNLALMYKDELKDIAKAEKYFLMAVEKGDAGAMYNLALMYKDELKDIAKAEKYYLMAADKGDVDAMNSLAWDYFMAKKVKNKALLYAEKSYQNEKNKFNSHTYSMVLLWHNEIENAYQVSQDFINDIQSIEQFKDDFCLFLIFLIAKKQYHLTLKIFNENPHNLKDRFKPIYYALMFFMRKEYPNEYRKMGGELKQTVDEIVEKVKKMEQDYQ